MTDADRAMMVRLFPAIEKIQDGPMKEKVMATWFHAWRRSNFPSIEAVHQFEPARRRIAYTNVEHTNQVCRACEAMAESLSALFPLKIQGDELRAGAILHDVDKLLIFDYETGGFSETGRRFAHAVLGASMALQEGLPESVAHMIGAHSFRFSPMPPATVEALLLRHLDHVVAQSHYFLQGLDMDRVLAESLAGLK